MNRTRAALLALTASLGLLLGGCVGPFAPIAMGKSIDIIFRVEFSQYQAVEGFDDNLYVIEEGDPALEEFKDLLREHGVEPWSYTAPQNEGCTGGIATTLRIDYHGAGTTDMVIDGCAAPDGSFEQEATAFFSGVEADFAAHFPSAEIAALEFSQHQAVEGFDDGLYRQEDPNEVARFRDLVDRYGIAPFSFSLERPAEPCPGSVATEVTVEYSGTDLVATMPIDSCTEDDGFSAEATELFTEWRESLAG